MMKDVQNARDRLREGIVVLIRVRDYQRHQKTLQKSLLQSQNQ